MDSIKTAVECSALKLGYTSVKSHQLTVIRTFIQGEDVFAVLPTKTCAMPCFLWCLIGPTLSDSGTPPSIVIVVTRSSSGHYERPGP